MCNQIFKSTMPNEMLFDLLDNICNKTEKYYIFNNESYKRGVLNNSIDEFFEKYKPFYHISKRFYLERKLSFNNLTTVVRQICKNNKITFTSKIKYDKSNYSINYFIYY